MKGPAVYAPYLNGPAWWREPLRECQYQYYIDVEDARWNGQQQGLPLYVGIKTHHLSQKQEDERDNCLISLNDYLLEAGQVPRDIACVCTDWRAPKVHYDSTDDEDESLGATAARPANPNTVRRPIFNKERGWILCDRSIHKKCGLTPHFGGFGKHYDGFGKVPGTQTSYPVTSVSPPGVTSDDTLSVITPAEEPTITETMKEFEANGIRFPHGKRAGSAKLLPLVQLYKLAHKRGQYLEKGTLPAPISDEETLDIKKNIWNPNFTLASQRELDLAAKNKEFQMDETDRIVNKFLTKYTDGAHGVDPPPVETALPKSDSSESDDDNIYDKMRAGVWKPECCDECSTLGKRCTDCNTSHDKSPKHDPFLTRQTESDDSDFDSDSEYDGDYQRDIFGFQ
jgi:hypothetical protein